MTGKERAAFRAKANSLEPLFHIGKGGISQALIKQTDDALRARELIKLKVLRKPQARMLFKSSAAALYYTVKVPNCGKRRSRRKRTKEWRQRRQEKNFTVKAEKKGAFHR